MKVLFLDFDGVLNNYKDRNFGEDFSKSSCKNLNSLLKKCPELKIVISSSWRYHGMEYCIGVLEKNGVDASSVIDVTGKEHGIRGNQIQAWLDRHTEVTAFVIVDDNSDMGELTHKLVKTNGFVGLTSKEVRLALQVLGQNK